MRCSENSKMTWVLRLVSILSYQHIKVSVKSALGIGLALIFLTACTEEITEKTSGVLPYQYINSYHNQGFVFLKSTINTDGTMDVFSVPQLYTYGPWINSTFDKTGGLLTESKLNPGLYQYPIVEEVYGFKIEEIGTQTTVANITAIDKDNNVIIFTPNSVAYDNAPSYITNFSSISKYNSELKHVKSVATELFIFSNYSQGYNAKIFQTSDGGYITQASYAWSDSDLSQDTLVFTKLNSQLKIEFVTKMSIDNLDSFLYYQYVGSSNTFIESSGKYYFAFDVGGLSKLFEINDSGFNELSNTEIPVYNTNVVSLPNGDVLTCTTGFFGGDNTSTDLVLHANDLSTSNYLKQLLDGDGYFIDVSEFFRVGSNIYFSALMRDLTKGPSSLKFLRIGYINPDFSITYKDVDLGIETLSCFSTPLSDGGFSLLLGVTPFENSNYREVVRLRVDADLNIVK